MLQTFKIHPNKTFKMCPKFMKKSSGGDLVS